MTGGKNLVDCVIHVDNTFYSTHKAVLKMVSPYLGNMVNDWIPGLIPLIVLPKVYKQTVKSILELIYDGHTFATKAEILSMIKLSTELKLRPLNNGLPQYLKMLTRRKFFFLFPVF